MEMNEHITAIGELLSDPSFYEVNKDLDKPEDIIAAIQAKVPGATEEEIDGFLTTISATLQSQGAPEGELTEESLEDVAGGIIVTAAVVGAVCKCIGTAVTVGGVIGGCIWYWQNRKK